MMFTILHNSFRRGSLFVHCSSVDDIKSPAEWCRKNGLECLESTKAEIDFEPTIDLDDGAAFHLPDEEEELMMTLRDI